MNEQIFRPDFEKEIGCPNRGVRTIDLTEIGHSQITEVTIGI